MKNPRRWFLGAMALVVVVGIAAALYAMSIGVTIESLLLWVRNLGKWAPIGFIVLYAVATVALVPGSAFDLAGGAFFGPYLGSAINLVGGSIGAALAFVVARYVARDWVEAKGGTRTHTVIHHVDEEGWRFVAFVRLVPIFPYNIMNYLLGMTRISFHQYFLATLVFMAPSTIAYTWMGYAGREAMSGNANSLYYVLIILGLIAVVLVLPRLVHRLRGSRPGALTGPGGVPINPPNREHRAEP